MKRLVIVLLATCVSVCACATDETVRQTSDVPTHSCRPSSKISGSPNFNTLNPHYKDRAGAFYDIKYVSPSAEALFKIADIRPDQMRQTLVILRQFVDEWLGAFVRGNGSIARSDVERCIGQMDLRIEDLLDNLQRKQYEIWRDDPSGEYNRLRFLMTAGNE